MNNFLEFFYVEYTDTGFCFISYWLSSLIFGINYNFFEIILKVCHIYNYNEAKRT